MSKNVFRAYEIEISPTKVHISPPPPVAHKRHIQDHDLEPVEATPVVEQYTGPSAADLRREADEFTANWEEEKRVMIEGAHLEASRIIKEAEDVAFDEIKKKTAQANEIKTEAETKAAHLTEQADLRVKSMITDAEKRVAEIEKDAYERGLEQGRVQGYDQGKTEAERLVDRIQVILNKTIERRSEIIDESESQIVGLVLSISKKIVKVLTENQKNVVINNVLQALRKLKNKSDVSIRVNIDDLKVTSDHVKEIVARIERVGNVSVMEDSTVDPGGCIIETDFGEIDARISSQFKEIEDRILEVTPIRTRTRDSGEAPAF
jgi:flagellar assembly protein FliH